jgi:methyl-accepting chemotaxis protein
VRIANRLAIFAALAVLAVVALAATTLVPQFHEGSTVWVLPVAGAAIVLLGIVSFFLMLTVRSVRGGYYCSMRVVDAAARGELSWDAVRPREGDELGDMLPSLQRMQVQLSKLIESERRSATENGRLRQALENVSSNVMVTDADLKIIYLNHTVRAMMVAAQADIRRDLQHFDAAALLGAPIDLFLLDPTQQRALRAGLLDSFEASIAIGERSFRIIANPIMAEGGTRLGTVVEWTDRTQEVAVEKEMQDMLAAVVRGELHKRIDLSNKAGFFEALSRGVNQLTDNLTEVVSRVKSAAEQVHRGAEEISLGNANLSQRTEQQASSLEETASSMEQMTATVKQNADNAHQANQLAVAAREEANKGGAVVTRAVSAMSGINEASRKIADIIGVIDEIAFQTNLLALNAAVEAARAGEQGRGFAVVATEVRNLAGRSATAARQIKELIQDSVRKVEDGSTLVTQSGDSLEQIVTAVKKVSDIVAEIAAASREQAAGIEQVNRAVMQMDQLTQQNAALVDQATAASRTMTEQSGSLTEMMATYRLQRDTPLALRTAKRA